MIGMAGLLAARKYLGLTPATEAKLQTLNQRYGAWALLLAWMPVIGDPLTVLAGLRVPAGGYLHCLCLADESRVT